MSDLSVLKHVNVRYRNVKTIKTGLNLNDYLTLSITCNIPNDTGCILKVIQNKKPRQFLFCTYYIQQFKVRSTKETSCMQIASHFFLNIMCLRYELFGCILHTTQYTVLQKKSLVRRYIETTLENYITHHWKTVYLVCIHISFADSTYRSYQVSSGDINCLDYIIMLLLFRQVGKWYLQLLFEMTHQV